MSKLFFVFSLIFAINAHAKRVHICVLDSGKDFQHEKQISEIIKNHINKKQDYRILSFPLYTKNGELDLKALLARYAEIKAKCEIINLSWNMKYDPSFDSFISAMNNLNLNRQVIVAATGAPTGNQISEPLISTVVGHLKNALVIGELSKKGHLATNSFHGEEILTAILPPQNLKGSSYSAALMTASLANHFFEEKNWSNVLKSKKSKSHEVWPSLDELFKK